MGQRQLECEFKRLESLSICELARSLEHAVGRERREVAVVIAHLSVLTERKGHLELGYPNVFTYCVEYLGLSRGTVWHRLQVANVARRFPQVLEALFRAEISLSVAGLLAPKLTAENVDELLARSLGRSKRQVEELLVEFSPKPTVSPGMARRPARRPRATRDGEPSPATPEKPSVPAFKRPRSELQPATPEAFNVRFSAPREFKDKLERLAEVLGVENPGAHLAELLEKALEIALYQRDPKERAERRAKRTTKRATAVSTSSPPSPAKVSPKEAGRSRYIPVALTDQVLGRAAHQCEYHAPDGRRCPERTSLEIDHRVPFARGGSSHPASLRVLCRRHNLFVAERTYGERFVSTQEEPVEQLNRVTHIVYVLSAASTILSYPGFALAASIAISSSNTSPAGML